MKKMLLMLAISCAVFTKVEAQAQKRNPSTILPQPQCVNAQHIKNALVNLARNADVKNNLARDISRSLRSAGQDSTIANQIENATKLGTWGFENQRIIGTVRPVNDICAYRVANNPTPIYQYRYR